MCRQIVACSSGTAPFFLDEDLMSSGVLEKFDCRCVPSGGWHVQDAIKTGTFFVQGRNKFYWYATAGPKEEVLIKVPGDVDSRNNRFMPSGCHREHRHRHTRSIK